MKKIKSEILKLYKENYPFESYYQNALNKIISNTLFKDVSVLNSVSIVAKSILEINDTKVGDIRVDLPIWFGKYETSKYKIIILGLEPRDSKSKYNIEKVDKFVFGTPFGIEYWNEKTKYYQAISSLINNKSVFIYFSDVVKGYEVKENKKASDINARNKFYNKATDAENVSFLKKEFSIIKPTHIIAFGNDSYTFLENTFGEKYTVVKVIHPSAFAVKGEAACKLARITIDKIFI